MKNGLTFLIVILTLNCLISGCGNDDVMEESVPDSLVEKMGGDENDIDRLYEELVGEYELIRAVVKFAESGEIFDLKPPDISGSMTITLNRTIRQEVEALGNEVIAEGTFELFPADGTMEVRQGAVIIPIIYTWDGSIFTTALDFGLYFETDYWRKL